METMVERITEAQKQPRPKHQVNLLEVAGDQLSGAQRGAILLISLGTEAASGVLKHMRDDDVEKITIQIALLRNLYDGTLSFSDSTMTTVRRVMVMEETDDYVLHGKTGWGILPDDTHIGWFVGYIERGENVYFFATNIGSTDPDFPMRAAQRTITFAILEALGIVEAG